MNNLHHAYHNYSVVMFQRNKSGRFVSARKWLSLHFFSNTGSTHWCHFECEHIACMSAVCIRARVGVYVDVFNLSGAIFKDWVWLPERDRLRIVERVQQSWWPSSAGVLRRHRCNTGWWRHHALRQLNVNYASALSVHPLKHHNHPPTCPLCPPCTKVHVRT